MDKKLLEQFKTELYNKREVLFDFVNKSPKSLEKEVGDSIDMAADSAEKELMFELNDHERNLLNEIDNAIQKIEHNSYGICECCGALISAPRLNVMPEARLCIHCQTKEEDKIKK